MTAGASKAGAYAARMVSDATRINRAGFEWGFGIRCTTGVAIALIAAYVSQQPLAGAGAAMGAMLAGFASRQGVHRTRATAMVATTVAMALAAFAGSTLGNDAVASALLLAAWGFGTGVVASLGPTAVTIGTNGAIALAVFGQFALSPQLGALEAGAVAAGGLAQTLLLVVLWPFERFTAERGVLAAAFNALATYARSLPGSRLRSPANAPFTQLGDIMADMQPFASRSELAAFETLFDEVERIRGTVGALAAAKYVLTRKRAQGAADAIDGATAVAAKILDEMGTAISKSRAPSDDGAWDAFDGPRTALQAFATRDLVARRALADLDRLLGELHAAWLACRPGSRSEAATSRAPRGESATERADALETLRANLSFDSEFARHGIRLAGVLGLCAILEHVLPIQRAYWIPLTAAIVLKPDFGTTYARGIARILGTLAGALLASAIAATHVHALALLALAVFFAGASYVAFNVNYAIFTTTITAYVVFLLAFGGFSESVAVLDRVEATALGGSIALATYALWPTWERRLLPRRLSELLAALREYGSALGAAYLEPLSANADAIHRAQAAAWLARSNADASFERMSAEPVKPSTVTVRAALGVLAASRRYGVALLSLNAHRPARPIAAAREFGALNEALDAALGVLVESLRLRRLPGPLGPIRERHAEFVAALGADCDAESTTATTETDLMVDALEGIHRILRRIYAGGAVPVEEGGGALRTGRA